MNAHLTDRLFPSARLLRTLWLVVAMAPTCPAAEYFVSASGSDTNPGTLAMPWRTVQKAADAVQAGDTVNVRAGVYSERVTLDDKHGTPASPIVFQKFAPDAGSATIDQSGVNPPDGTSALLTIRDCDHVTIRGLEFANYKTSGTNAQQKSKLPVGIFITGGGAGIRILDCKVHDIWQSCATANDFSANGFGIAVYGTSAVPISGLEIDGCEVYDLRTGASESVVLNGNVVDFRVTNNRVHDCNNIGIDFIGFEGTRPDTASDQARNGVCSGNVVYRIDSKFNPAYGGNFTSGGNNNTRAAPGLYVDGGRDIVIERNHVFDCNFAVSVGSENAGKVVSGVIVRDNILNHCHVGGIVIGGSGTDNGGADACAFTNNTLYGNDTVGQGGGQIMIQHYVTNTLIQRNIMAATAEFVQFVLKDNNTGSFAAGAIDWNMYRLDAGDSYEFIWNGVAYSNFANWKTASALAKDANSLFTTALPGFASNAPSVGASASDFALVATSPARDTGDSSIDTFVPGPGERAFSGQSRVANFRVDIGADEFMTGWQAWRDKHFQRPDGGEGAEPQDDPDGDAAKNLVEYSQGADPNFPDVGKLPRTSRDGSQLKFEYRRAAPDLTYAVRQTLTLLGSWEHLEAT